MRQMTTNYMSRYLQVYRTSGTAKSASVRVGCLELVIIHLEIVIIHEAIMYLYKTSPNGVLLSHLGCASACHLSF